MTSEFSPPDPISPVWEESDVEQARTYLSEVMNRYKEESVNAVQIAAKGNRLGLDPVVLHRWRGDEQSCMMDVKEQIVWADGFATFASDSRLVKSGKSGYYEVKLLSGGCIQLGWASKRFEQKSSYVPAGVGDAPGSWGIDGTRQVQPARRQSFEART